MAASNRCQAKGHVGEKQEFPFLRVELRALLISGPLSRVRKVRSCKVQILICA